MYQMKLLDIAVDVTMSVLQKTPRDNAKEIMSNLCLVRTLWFIAICYEYFFFTEARRNPFPPALLSNKDEDFIAVDNMTSWIADAKTRFMVNKYMLFCPEQDMCLGPDFQRTDAIKHYPACLQCDCTSSCLRKANCCPSQSYMQNESVPDYVQFDVKVDTETTRFDSVPLVCRIPLLNDHSKIKSSLSYWMIETCPDNFPRNEEWRQCSGNALEIRSVSLYRPVTSIATNETYRNKACALCHNEASRDLIEWDAVKICEFRPDLFSLSNIDDFATFVLADNDTCNIEFRPPPHTSNFTNVCILNYIDECNVTLKWDEYDEKVANACTSSVVVPYSDCSNVFKNIYCKLCNVAIQDISSIPYQCFGPIGKNVDYLPSFSALLNFRKDDNQIDESSSECGRQRIYDSIQKKCLPIICDSSFQYKQSECKSKYEMVGESNYEISLFITPENKIKEQNYKGVAMNLNSVIDETLDVHNLSQYLCRSSILKKDDEKILNMDETNMRFASVIELSVSHLHAVQHFTNRILTAFASDTPNGLKRRLWPNFTVSVVGQEFHIYHQNLFIVGPYSRYFIDPTTKERMLRLTLNINYDNMGSGYCNAAGLMSIVAPSLICPKVVIRKVDTPILISNFSLCLIEYDYCVESPFFKETPNQTMVEICLEKYIEATSIRTQRDVNTIEIYLSLVCASLSTCGSFLTSVVFLGSRDKLNVPLMNTLSLSITTTLANPLYTLSKIFIDNETACIAIGMVCHFLWLSVISWMTISCFHIFRFFTVFFMVDSNDKSMKRFFWYLGANILFCMCMVLINISVSYITTSGNSLGYSTVTCYIATSQMNLYTFALPVALLVVLNIFMFINTFSRILDNADTNKTKHKKMIKVFFRLSLVSGCTWIFGFLHGIFYLELFSYLHILFNGSLGVLIFFIFGLPKMADYECRGNGKIKNEKKSNRSNHGDSGDKCIDRDADKCDQNLHVRKKALTRLSIVEVNSDESKQEN